MDPKRESILVLLVLVSSLLLPLLLPAAALPYNSLESSSSSSSDLFSMFDFHDATGNALATSGYDDEDDDVDLGANSISGRSRSTGAASSYAGGASSSSSSGSSASTSSSTSAFRPPIVHLVEEKDPSLDPTGTHLENPDALLQILGEENFIRDFMSVRDPSAGPEAVDLVLKPNRWESTRFDSEVSHLMAGDKKLLASKVGQKIKKRLSNLLFEFTQCPVVYSWKDLGLRFWPRFIRQGSCSRQKSCSFPAGMGCKAAEQSHLTVLRFYCGTRRWGRAEAQNPDRSNCRWITIQYPIITKCACSC